VIAILALGGAVILRRYWPSRATPTGDGGGGAWYPDPAVVPPRWRRYDGEAWTSDTRTARGYLYGMCIPVTGKFSRIWNAGMGVCTML
jgi:hypothetical protein